MGESCTTPDELIGSCIGIRQCKSILTILRRNPLADEDRKFVLDSHCEGIENKLPKVCCADRKETTTQKAVIITESSEISRHSTEASTQIGLEFSQLPPVGVCSPYIKHNRIVGGEIAAITAFPWYDRIVWI